MTLRDLARRVVAHRWPVAEESFDLLWETCAEYLPDNLVAVSPQGHVALPALASVGPRTDQVTATVLICVAVSRQLDIATRDQLVGHVRSITQLLGLEGAGEGMLQVLNYVSTPETVFTGAPAVPKIVATAYTHDGELKLSQEQLVDLLKRKAEFDIFIHHFSDLGPEDTGHIFLKGQAAHSPSRSQSASHSYLRPLEYRILKFALLARENDAERRLSNLVRDCWDVDLVKTGAGNSNADVYADATSFCRSAFSRCSKILNPRLGIRVRCVSDTVYLDPWPATFCVLVERAGRIA